MSAKNPNAELPPDTVAGEYVELDVDLFLKGSMHIALATTLAKVRGSERTTKDELRESFDRMFRSLLKTSSDGKFPTA